MPIYIFVLNYALNLINYIVCWDAAMYCQN